MVIEMDATSVFRMVNMMESQLVDVMVIMMVYLLVD